MVYLVPLGNKVEDENLGWRPWITPDTKGGIVWLSPFDFGWRWIRRGYRDHNYSDYRNLTRDIGHYITKARESIQRREGIGLPTKLVGIFCCRLESFLQIITPELAVEAAHWIFYIYMYIILCDIKVVSGVLFYAYPVGNGKGFPEVIFVDNV